MEQRPEEFWSGRCNMAGKSGGCEQKGEVVACYYRLRLMYFRVKSYHILLAKRG